MVRVIFTYDKQARKWESTVEGANTNIEARQAFSAVVLTCQELDPTLLTGAQSESFGDHHKIIPAV